MDYDPHVPNPYGYHPSLAVGIIFLILFGTSMAMHVWQAFHYRTRWLAAFALGAFGEFVGWIARTVAYRCSYSVRFFEMQLASLIMGEKTTPLSVLAQLTRSTALAFTTAGIYIILSVLIPIVGLHTSPLPPKPYLVIFMIVDFFSLLLQAIGGGMAVAAFTRNTDTRPSTYIMVSGILFQLVSTCVFATLFEIPFFRASTTIRMNKHLLVICSATMLSVTCMIIRGVYRSIELLQGWRGYLITNERFTIALDGTMMFIAVAIFNLCRPGDLFPKARATAQAQLQTLAEADIELERKDKGKERSQY